MKVRISPNGDVEFDVSNGEGQVALDLIRAIQNQAQVAPIPAFSPLYSMPEESDRPLTYGERLEKVRQEQAESTNEVESDELEELRKKLSSASLAHSASMAHLNAKQRNTYDTLVEFDSPEGVHVTGLAILCETSVGAMSHRLSILERNGLVKRISRGYYRAEQ